MEENNLQRNTRDTVAGETSCKPGRYRLQIRRIFGLGRPRSSRESLQDAGTKQQIALPRTAIRLRKRLYEEIRSAGIPAGFCVGWPQPGLGILIKSI